jgi:hypothetical protein
VPAWLSIAAMISLATAAVCALTIAADILAGHRQRMWVMNLVWPITALYAGPLGLWAYYAVGRQSAQDQAGTTKKQGHPAGQKPFWQSVGLAATHCGSGCTLGDIVAEWVIFFVPFTLFGRTMYAAWVVDYILAFLFGIAFQYYTIKPMRNLSPGEGIRAALKADTLSLTSWQIGMYGWMALATLVIFGRELPKTSPVFWFMMQIAMLAGFLTSYPVNWWLVRKGIKEQM